MADDLKRVGLVFTEKGAVDFRKSLQEVNLEMNKNYNQFKLTQAQWNESTAKVQKLTEEQKYLAEAYELQGDKVKTLRMQLNDLENAENKNVTSIKKKQNELTNAEIKLQNYKNKLEKTNTTLENTRKGFETATEKLKRLNNEIKENESKFNLAKSQWNAMTKESEKLATEQQYLTEAYRLQSEKLNTLKGQLLELESVEDKNTNAISKKKQEIIKTETELNNYKTKLQIVTNQLENFSAKMITTGEKIENVGKKVEGAGKKMSAFSVATGTALLACAKTAIDFEDAFTGVEKTVDGTEQQMAELKQGIRDMAKEIPSTTTEISAVAEAAGQLGIKTEDVLSFTRVMIDLGNSTNLSAEEAASALAKFANVTKMSAKDYDKLGATIVELGNNFATTERDIVEMATRLAATGDLAGLSQAQILSLATAMSSVGIEAEAGGSAMSKLLKKIQVACEAGSGDLKDFAKVAGMTTKDFKKAFEKDAVKALSAFISGLNDTKRNGKSAIAILEDMDIKEIRLSNTILSLASAGDLMNRAVETGNKAWEENTALTNEANKRYGTLKSQITTAMNKIKDLAITFGNKLKPIMSKIIKDIEKLTEWISNLNEEQVETILKIGAIVVAIRPLLTILGKVTSIAGGAIKNIGLISQAIGVMKGTVTTTDVAVNGLAKTFKAISNPTTIAITGIVAVIGGLKLAMEKATEETRNYSRECERSLQKTLEQEKAIKELNAEIDKNTQEKLAEIETTQSLWTELKKITDENGKIKEGYETRAKVITGKLAEALGIEITTTGNVINKYKELQTEIDKLILKKKGEAILQGYEEKYNNAIAQRTQKTQELIDKQKELQKAKEKEAELYKKYAQEDGEMQWGWQVQKIYKDWTKQKQAVQDLEKEVGSLQKTVGNCTLDIENYQYGLELYTEGTTDSLNKMIEQTGKTYQKNEETVKTTFEQQIKEQQLYNDSAKKLYREAEEKHNESEKKKSSYTISESQTRLTALIDELISQTSVVGDNSEDIINAWKTLATDSYETYYNTISPLDEDLKEKIQEMTGVTVEQTPYLVGATANMSQEVLEQLKQNSEFRATALDNLRGMLSGLQDSELREVLKLAGIEDVDKVIQGIKEGNLSEEQGIEILSKLNMGLNNKNWQSNVFSTATTVASKLQKILTINPIINGATVAINEAVKRASEKLPRT